MADDYLPTVRVVATLFAKGGGSELYKGYHSTGWEQKADGWRHAPAQRKFSNFQALMAKPSESAAALTECAQIISGSITADLRRN